MKITVTDTGNYKSLDSIASLSERGQGTYIGRIGSISTETMFIVGEMVEGLGIPVVAFDLKDGDKRCWVVPHTLTAKGQHYCQQLAISNLRPCEITEIKVIS